MAKGNGSDKKPIEFYDHKGKERLNNPPVGLVTPETDKEGGKKTYAYDPHLDPQLVWAGKAEHTSFEVPTVSLHVHERIEPRTIVEAVRKRNGQKPEQGSLFEMAEENPPLREAIEFYKHRHNWSNRMVAGDSLLVMNSLLEKEGMAGQVQMIYIDPPYGIRYGSNFQPFVNKRDVKDGKDEDLTAEPEMIKAFRDTWELGIHSYLAYLRDRLLLAKELLSESGSIFMQISDENLHRAKCLMDEAFGGQNACTTILMRKSGWASSTLLAQVHDFILWYAKDKNQLRYRQLFTTKRLADVGDIQSAMVESSEGICRSLSREERENLDCIPSGWTLFFHDNLTSTGYSSNSSGKYVFQNKEYWPGSGGRTDRHWKTLPAGLDLLAKANRLIGIGESLRQKRYFEDFPYSPVADHWDDTAISGFAERKVYVVQTNTKAVERCLLMTTDPGDLVLDITCGSGTTAFVAEQWGRRWVTCDTSRVAITLAKQRLMTAMFDYYQLAQPAEGVGSGFKYKTVPHVTLKSIANNEPPARETLYDQPFVDNKRSRVTGPFTVEAVPAPMVKPLSDITSDERGPADSSISRSGETLRQAEWRDELLRTGIRGKNKQFILFSRVEPLPGTRWLHADAETKPNTLGADTVKETPPGYGQPERAVISFGPEHGPLEKKQVEQAIQEAQRLVPKPTIILFAAFQFDPEAAREIDEINWPGVTLLKAQMNADLLTEDLKKKRATNESFWLVGQPDVVLRKAVGKSAEQPHSELYQVEVLGFDYYNTKTGVVESGGTENIAMWMLDPDYDGRSLFPRQVFFPMAGENEGWSRLARNLKAEIDENLIEAYRGTVSLPFETGENRRIAVKIVDDRGIESLKILEVEAYE